VGCDEGIHGDSGDKNEGKQKETLDNDGRRGRGRGRGRLVINPRSKAD